MTKSRKSKGKLHANSSYRRLPRLWSKPHQNNSIHSFAVNHSAPHLLVSHSLQLDNSAYVSWTLTFHDDFHSHLPTHTQVSTPYLTVGTNTLPQNFLFSRTQTDTPHITCFPFASNVFSPSPTLYFTTPYGLKL